jgi:SAM-dependent methyltransferase
MACSEALLICRLRAARKKARVAAVAEALALLRDVEATPPAGGPLSEQGGLFWIALPVSNLELARSRLPRLGYTAAVELLEPVEPSRSTSTARRAHPDAIRWRGSEYRPVRVYEADEDALRDDAPDRRLFLLEGVAGDVRAIRGYRGDGGTTSRRALPVCDARLLVNLVTLGDGALFLDPFAGAGGIVHEATAARCRVVTTDLDPILRHGLRHLGACHAVANAARLPFGDARFDAIATEPPYHPEADADVYTALHEMARVLKPGGRIAVLCVPRQAERLRREAVALGLCPCLDTPIQRKGLDVVALAWKKSYGA